jgi:hypothetical protein
MRIRIKTTPLLCFIGLPSPRRPHLKFAYHPQDNNFGLDLGILAEFRRNKETPLTV